MKRLVISILLGISALPLLLLAALTPSAPAAVVAGQPDAGQVRAAPASLRPFFLEASRRFVLPPALLVAIAKVESGFSPNAVGVPTPYGRALGMMQFLPSSWRLFNVVPGATEFDPRAAILAAANHLLTSGRLANGGWDAAQAVFGYNHSTDYVDTVLGWAAQFGYDYDPNRPPMDSTRYRYPLAGAGDVVACVRSKVLSVAPANNRTTTLVLRGEDGWLYHYRDLSKVRPRVRVGAVTDAGAALGTAERNAQPATTATFAITRGDSTDRAVNPAPYLELWRQHG